MNKLKAIEKNKGITLIALIVTIVVLLILAGVSIAMLTGENGIIEKVETAKEKNNESQIKENKTLADYENKISNYVDGSRDTVTIPKEEYDKLKNANVYSEDEIEVGTWIDGKTIYRKYVYIGNLASSASNTEYAHNINNIDKITNIDGMFTSSDGETFCPGNRSSITSSAIFGIHATKSSVVVAIGENRSSWTGYAILEYTKTTDTATSN